MLRIALADDQALIRHGLKALLETLGGIQVVVEADNGDSLLDALASHEVEAVLADIRMPRLSGIGALKALRQRGNFVPVILLTTFDDPHALKEGISAGAAGYLLKDAQPETLKQVLEAAVLVHDPPYWGSLAVHCVSARGAWVTTLSIYVIDANT